MLVLAVPCRPARPMLPTPNKKRGDMKTIERSPEVVSAPRRRGLIRGLGIAALIGIALPVTALAFDSLNVDLPFLPAVGESAAEACDSDGVATSFTYGNTSSNGIRVTSVTVDGIAANCTNLTVDFMDGETPTASYSGAVVGTTTTLTTSVFTNTFNSVRVLLGP